MLEECALPYVVRPVDISKGEQFAPHFLAVSPNNRIPAIVDPAGPGGRPIAVFESGAILQYLGRKSGKFYPRDERARAAVEEWLYWQVGGLGPMAGQAIHFRHYAPEPIIYAIARYTDEVNRLYGVMNSAAGRPRILGRPLFDRRHGLRRLGAACRAPGSRSRRRSRTSNAGSKPSARARRSSALSPSVSRRLRKSTCATRRCARCCSASGRGKREPILPWSRFATCKKCSSRSP